MDMEQCKRYGIMCNRQDLEDMLLCIEPIVCYLWLERQRVFVFLLVYA